MHIEQVLDLSSSQELVPAILEWLHGLVPQRTEWWLAIVFAENETFPNIQTRIQVSRRSKQTVYVVVDDDPSLELSTKPSHIVFRGKLCARKAAMEQHLTEIIERAFEGDAFVWTEPELDGLLPCIFDGLAWWIRNAGATTKAFMYITIPTTVEVDAPNGVRRLFANIHASPVHELIAWSLSERLGHRAPVHEPSLWSDDLWSTIGLLGQRFAQANQTTTRIKSGTHSNTIGIASALPESVIPADEPLFTPPATTEAQDALPVDEWLRLTPPCIRKIGQAWRSGVHQKYQERLLIAQFIRCMFREKPAVAMRLYYELVLNDTAIPEDARKSMEAFYGWKDSIPQTLYLKKVNWPRTCKATMDKGMCAFDIEDAPQQKCACDLTSQSYTIVKDKIANPWIYYSATVWFTK